MKYLDPEKGVEAEKTVGKTVAFVGIGYVDGAHDSEPTVYFVFTDETWTGVTMSSEDWLAMPKATIKIRKK